ncbi:sensor histidine kinase [Pseudomonas sp. NW5]|uniref:sensor histidine kinase n=1 Tax=Pseudomonas sp. NW5 TaxID=2934934 RepID=UPI002020BF7F|nr:sensor histidine kinase [Pseudomonas sp. NW5]MCL7463017.1 sensor histidine kinase [Pseudomonas sp. NW5]
MPAPCLHRHDPLLTPSRRPACLWLWVLLLLWPALACAAPASVQLAADFRHLNLYGQLQASPPDQAPASPQEALAAFRAGQFVALPGHLGRGYRSDSVWLAFELDARAAPIEQVVLDIAPSVLDRVIAYQTDGNGQLRLTGIAGDQIASARWMLPALRPAFLLDLYDTPRTTVLLHLQTQSIQAAIVKLHHPALYPLHVTGQGLLLGAVLTVNLLMMLGALATFVLLRDPLALYWLAYVATLSLVWVINDGLLTHLLAPNDPALLNQLTSLSSSLLIAVGCLLFTRLLRTREYLPRLYRLQVLWAGLSIGAALPATLLGLPAVLSWVLVVSLPLFLLMILGTAWQMLQRQREALLHGPILLLHLLSTLLYLIAALGWIGYSETLLWLWQAAGFIHLLMLQVTLLRRVRRRLQASEQARRMALQTLTENNQRLELMVEERTAHLQQAIGDLRHAEAAQTQLLMVACHEFRTPAAMIKASLDSLRLLDCALPGEVQRRLDNIRRTGERLSDVASSLISHERLRHQALQPQMSRFDLVALLARAVTEHPQVERLQRCLPPGPLPWRGDAGLLRIALYNLIDNAFAHSPPASLVNVSLQVTASQLLLEVDDQGCGIPDADKAGVFERFRSGSDELGRGLGLYIVRLIAIAHGGEVQALDNQPRGTRMCLSLPRTTAERATVQSSHAL